MALSLLGGVVTLKNLKTLLSRASRRIWAAVFLCALASAALAGEPAPELKVQTLSGGAFSLESLKGQVVVLDFWASWCVPCRTSFPFLDTLQDKYQSRGLRVVGLTLEDNADAVQAFLYDVPARFTIVRDPSGKAGEAFQVVAMPTTFLLDRDGRIVARFEGGDKSVHAKIEAAVATLLSGAALPSGADVRVSKSVEATGSLKAWQREYLADPIMNLDGDPITRMLREHIHASKEGAAGDGGAAGGGCGCN
jgi:cytochrome c biogenesis protein CcmG, thiol:disulfide interchange protein DsbE